MLRLLYQGQNQRLHVPNNIFSVSSGKDPIHVRWGAKPPIHDS